VPIRKRLFFAIGIAPFTVAVFFDTDPDPDFDPEKAG